MYYRTSQNPKREGLVLQVQGNLDSIKISLKPQGSPAAEGLQCCMVQSLSHRRSVGDLFIESTFP